MSHSDNTDKPDPALLQSPTASTPHLPYTGRFAPSPTGPLHFGSLISALASYLEARHHSGQWLVRMEDLDPPREQPGAADNILRSLEQHGLHWDGDVLYQSQRLPAYEELLQQLIEKGLAYPCDCTRQQIKLMGGPYNGHCRSAGATPDSPFAMRVKVVDLPPPFEHVAADIRLEDRYQGQQHENLPGEVGDFIIRRKDQLFAYQLAVVADDIFQGITHVVRGSDLLDSSARQLFLFQLLEAPPPSFSHIPVALNSQGQKLSKQNLAPALDPGRTGLNLWRALHFLQQQPDDQLRRASPADILSWAREHWQADKVKCCMGIAESPAPLG